MYEDALPVALASASLSGMLHACCVPIGMIKLTYTIAKSNICSTYCVVYFAWEFEGKQLVGARPLA